MEKISEDERIKRAEEISARRNNRIPVNNINIKQTKRKMSTLSKLFIQVLCSICIFGVCYLINQNNSIAMEKIKPILSEDTDFGGIFNQINDFFKKISNSENKDLTQDDLLVNNVLENEVIQNTENEIQENIVSENEQNVENIIVEENTSDTEETDVGIGGGDEKLETSEEDQDIIFIKEQASFIKPVVGYITSGYGQREPTEIISANHAGVDIGANSGTDIIASMSGTVELISNAGDYGNHLKITNGEITTLYAHCSKIIVNEGDYINQGQKIAEVGSTGRTTGPHLHFEIRRNDKTVDPQKILDL